MKLAQIYHVNGCGCADCQSVKLAAGDEWGDTFEPIPGAITEGYLRKVWKSKLGKNGVDEKMWQEYFDRLREGVFKGGQGKGMLLRYGPDWVFNQELFSNVAVFSAFKNHANTHEMIGHLMNKDGTLKSFRQFQKDTAGIVANYNQNWLQAEYQTAIAGTRMATKWQNFERRASVYPNLKYVTQHDDRVRPEHQLLDGIIQPINSDFWKKHYPPNGWRCRCDVIQTDAKPTDPDTKGYIPDPLFQNNVGLDKAIFPSTHPYFDELTDSKAKIEAQAKQYFGKTTRDEVREWAKQNLSNGKFEQKLDELPMPVTITNQEIKAVTGKNHVNQATRNQILYILPSIWSELEFVKKVADDGKHPSVVEWYYYKWVANGVDYFFNFRLVQVEKEEQRIGLWAITDVEPQ